jgi:hypothetical protein
MATVTGISDHIGWAELVTLSVRDRAPLLVDRRRAGLVGPGLASAPYHHEGLALPLDKVEPIIRETRASVDEHCRRVLEALASSLRVDAIVIQESPYAELPDSVARVFSSRALTCAADGMLYREAIATQAAAIGLAVHRTPRKSDRMAAAARALGWSVAEVAAVVARFGQEVGVPWRKEHREAAASALAVLAAGDGAARLEPGP